jgi:hypothetical protein
MKEELAVSSGRLGKEATPSERGRDARENTLERSFQGFGKVDKAFPITKKYSAE